LAFFFLGYSKILVSFECVDEDIDDEVV